MSLESRKTALQEEVRQLKGRGAKLTRSTHGPQAPLPITITVALPRPAEAAAYDVDALTVRLVLDSLDTTVDDAVRVQVLEAADLTLPQKLKMRIAHRVLDRWESLLDEGTEAGGFGLAAIFDWCTAHYVELVGLCPELLEMYEAVDESGVTVRRYQLLDAPLAPAAAPEEPSQSEDESSGGAEDDSAVDEEARRLERIRLKAEEEIDRQWRAARRKEAEELGEAAKGPGVVSKKEQQARIKEKQEKRQGHRLRKQGARANKFDAEAAGKTKCKNGLMT